MAHRVSDGAFRYGNKSCFMEAINKSLPSDGEMPSSDQQLDKGNAMGTGLNH